MTEQQFYTPPHITKYISEQEVKKPVFEVGVNYYMVSLLHTIQKFSIEIPRRC